MTATVPRLLVIAGSDSSGGAGIQADLKTAQAFGVYAQTAVTAITVQDTAQVHSVNPLTPESVRRDLLWTDAASRLCDAPRQQPRHTHGTGCTLATAIACGLAQKLSLKDAMAHAHAYVQEAIRTAPGLGHGSGPLNHFGSPK